MNLERVNVNSIFEKLVNKKVNYIKRLVDVFCFGDETVWEIAVSSGIDNVGKEGVYEVIEQGSNLFNWLSNSSGE